MWRIFSIFHCPNSNESLSKVIWRQQTEINPRIKIKKIVKKSCSWELKNNVFIWSITYIKCQKVWFSKLLNYKFMKEKAYKVVSIVWIKTNNNNKCPFFDHFWPFFRQLYVYLSQKWGSDCHFDVLNRSKIELVQRLWHKMQIFPFSVFCNFVQKHTSAFFAFLRFVS